jgi:K+-transporting ATPase KdpF subunit
VLGFFFPKHKGLSPMTWLVGGIAAALFAYLFYALIKPERF